MPRFCLAAVVLPLPLLSTAEAQGQGLTFGIAAIAPMIQVIARVAAEMAVK